MVKTNQSMFIAVIGKWGCIYGRQNDVICYVSKSCLDHIFRTCEFVILHGKDKTEVEDVTNHSVDLRIGRVP